MSLVTLRTAGCTAPESFDASKGTAEKGEAICRHQVKGFIELLRDLMRYPLSNLYSR